MPGRLRVGILGRVLEVGRRAERRKSFLRRTAKVLQIATKLRRRAFRECLGLAALLIRCVDEIDNRAFDLPGRREKACDRLACRTIEVGNRACGVLEAAEELVGALQRDRWPAPNAMSTPSRR